MNKKLLLIMIFVVIILGILSRIIGFESSLLNKYLGDSLYAVLVYLFISLFFNNLSIQKKIIYSLLVLLSIELFQLTLIPLQMSQSENIYYRLLSKLLGTKFSLNDILAYIVGIFFIAYSDFKLYKYDAD